MLPFLYQTKSTYSLQEWVMCVAIVYILWQRTGYQMSHGQGMVGNTSPINLVHITLLLWHKQMLTQKKTLQSEMLKIQYVLFLWSPKTTAGGDGLVVNSSQYLSEIFLSHRQRTFLHNDFRQPPDNGRELAARRCHFVQEWWQWW